MAGRWIAGRHYDATMSSPGWHAVAAGASDIGAMILVRAWERVGDDAAFLADLRSAGVRRARTLDTGFSHPAARIAGRTVGTVRP